jgi:hypothetical protein
MDKMKKGVRYERFLILFIPLILSKIRFPVFSAGLALSAREMLLSHEIRKRPFFLSS